MNLSKILIFLFVVYSNIGWSQNSELAAVYIQGDVKIYSSTESPKKAKNLIYGPLKWDQVLILKENSRIKILRDNGETCEINIPGNHPISSLKFIAKSDNSIFSKFSSYFLTFFGSQNNSENKDFHINSIFAASRGEDDIPYLLFPFKDTISLDDEAIEFHWSHKCDTCNFILQIYDFDTRALIFQSYMKSTTYTLTSSSKYLKPGRKFFWNIQLDKTNQKSVSNSFVTAANGRLGQTVKTIDHLLVKNKIEPNTLTGYLITVANLLDANHPNFAFQVVRRAKLRFPKNSQLIEKLDMICADELKKRTKD